jgi:hypothetical protein
LKKKTKPREKLSTVKKKAWAAFSEYVRTRDCLRTTGCASFGLCITCGKRNHFKLLQAGHFIAGRHNAVLFSEKGVHEYLEYEATRTVKLSIQDCKLIEKYYKQKTEELLTGGIVDTEYMQSQSANIEESLKSWRDNEKTL